jgi:hypothetical protein
LCGNLVWILLFVATQDNLPHISLPQTRGKIQKRNTFWMRRSTGRLRYQNYTLYLDCNHFCSWDGTARTTLQKHWVVEASRVSDKTGNGRIIPEACSVFTPDSKEFSPGYGHRGSYAQIRYRYFQEIHIAKCKHTQVFRNNFYSAYFSSRSLHCSDASHLEREIQIAMKEKKYSQVTSLRTKFVVHCSTLNITSDYVHNTNS